MDVRSAPFLVEYMQVDLLWTLLTWFRIEFFMEKGKVVNLLTIKESISSGPKGKREDKFYFLSSFILQLSQI